MPLRRRYALLSALLALCLAAPRLSAQPVLAVVDHVGGGLSLPNRVVHADFNGDARPDLAVTNFGEESVSVLVNAGAGFAPPATYPTGAAVILWLRETSTPTPPQTSSSSTPTPIRYRCYLEMATARS